MQRHNKMRGRYLLKSHERKTTFPSPPPFASPDLILSILLTSLFFISILLDALLQAEAFLFKETWSSPIDYLMHARIICHIDLDCFYAQVEALRLGIDFRNVPYVLVQWGGLIAVNYPARRLGIGRFETLRDALAKCPEIQYSHVPTYRVGHAEYQYHANPDKATHKVSLDPYRRASKKIFDVLGSFPGVLVEKGGVDEAYLDVTEAAQAYIDTFYAANGKHLSLEDVTPFTKLCPNREEELREFLQCQNFTLSSIGTFAPAPTESYHRLLHAGCVVVKSIRDKVRSELGFDCSAGVSHNRMLSKCISALFKPNQQTLLHPEGTLGFLFDFKFSKLRMFGGKLGQSLEQGLNATTCGDLWRFNADAIGDAIGDKDGGTFVFRRVRGFDANTVVPRSMSKSLLAQKVFSPSTDDMSVLRMWFVVLAQELLERLQDFGEEYGVCGRLMHVKLGGSGLVDASDIGSKSFPLPTPTTAEALTSVALRYASIVINNSRERVLINSVSLSLSDFRKLHANEDTLSIKQQTLDSLFKKRIRESMSEPSKHDDDEVVIVDPPEARHLHPPTSVHRRRMAARNVVVIDVDDEDTDG